MLPAAPELVVATDIAPPWVIATIGLEATMEPAAPVPSAVEKIPAAPLMARELEALTVIVPPCPAPVVLLSIRPVSARFTVFAASAVGPAAPTPSVVLKIPLRASLLKLL